MNRIIIKYTNESNQVCEATINDPLKTDHSYWTHNRNAVGKFEKIEITVIRRFLDSLKNCKNIYIFGANKIIWKIFGKIKNM